GEHNHALDPPRWQRPELLREVLTLLAFRGSGVVPPCHSAGMDGAVTQLARIVDDLAGLTRDFDAGVLDGKQAQRVVCAAADIERFAVTIKTLAVRRVDETGAWRTDGSRSPQKWLARTTHTSLSDAYGTLELGEQLD